MILAAMFKHTVTQTELEQLEQEIRDCEAIMTFAAKKLRSRAIKVKHILELPKKYMEKFGGSLLDDYRNHLHAEALAAHQIVYGGRRS